MEHDYEKPLGPRWHISIFATSAQAFDDKIEWNVSPDFAGKKAPLEISGAVCPGSNSKLTWCYAVDDETKRIHAFEIKRRTVVPGKRQRMFEKKDGNGKKLKEPDLEAVAYADGFVYFTGSHSHSRKKKKKQPTRNYVYRMPVDAATGKTPFDFDKDEIAKEIESSDKLKIVLEESGVMKPLLEHSDFKDDDGFTKVRDIEGLAVLDGNMYFGFRAPVLDGKAIVVKVAVDQIFSDAENSEEIYRPDIGSKYGIRDLAVLGDTIVILGGAREDEKMAPTVWSWVPRSQPRLLRVLDAPSGAKAESLLLLNAVNYDVDNPKEDLRGLVFFDGPMNGAPTEYILIEKK